MELLGDGECEQAKQFSRSTSLHAAHAAQAIFALLTIVTIVGGIIRHRRLLRSRTVRANCPAAASRQRASLRLLLRAGLGFGALLGVSTLALRGRELVFTTLNPNVCVARAAWFCLLLRATTSFSVIGCNFSLTFILIERHVSSYCLPFYGRQRILSSMLLGSLVGAEKWDN